MQRIATGPELEGFLTLEQPFQERFVALFDQVNGELAGDDEVAVRAESFRRDGADQLVEWRKGRAIVDGRWVVVDAKAVVTFAAPGQSMHERGLAAHLVLHNPSTGAWLPNSHARWLWLRDRVEANGLVSGARFKTPRGKPFFDAAHVEARR